MRLYDTLDRTIKPLDPPSKDSPIKLYTCGLTVYSQPHIGNWVAYIYWDVLVRTLKANGYDVTRVQNITDVGHLTSDEDAGEDKMQKGALREGKTAWEVAQKYIDIAHKEAYGELGLLEPDKMPRATQPEFIEKQKQFVEELHAKGFTYVIDDGIYFDTSKLDDYGKLAQLDIEGLRFGARVADTGKKNPTDFAVWKFSNPDEKRDMEWDSPVVNDKKGFPGWHLECSVMARELLGDTIDIHTGGVDHIPVHHTNEIAQTEAITGRKFSNFWVHANHMKVNGTKMSKSLGNIYTLQDIEDKDYDLDAFKLLVLSKHYQTEGNFTWDILRSAQNRLMKWRAAADMIWQTEELTVSLKGDISKARKTIEKCMNENLDTVGAFKQIDIIVPKIRWGGRLAKADLAETKKLFSYINEVFGINLIGEDKLKNPEVANLVEEIREARLNKDYDQSKIIKQKLNDLKIDLNFGKDSGQEIITWFRFRA